MIEKIMKAVKSGNKKRGRNITTGVVVGMLLSCTVIMGAGEIGLEITKGDSGIEFIKGEDKFEPGKEKDPYSENNLNENIYTNNTILSGTNGLKLSGDLNEFEFINNGTITGMGDNDSGIITHYTLDNLNLTNNGSIVGAGQYSSGIDGSASVITDLINNGSIIGRGQYGSGINTYNPGALIGSLINKGVIDGNTAMSTDADEVTTFNNYGLLYGKAGALTIGDDPIINFNNHGLLYGKESAVRYIGRDVGINNFNNYGLLVSGTADEDTIKSVELKEENNYGLIFKAVEGTYSATEKDFANFGTTAIADGYTIINAKAKGVDKDNITGTESLSLENGVLTYNDSEEKASSDGKYVLNGITDTLKVTGGENKLNNSVINAYGTAVVMDENESTLVLNNTVVNGGALEGNTVNITGDGNNFTVRGDSVINTKDETTAIAVVGNDNAVVLSGNVIVNGKIEATGTGHFLDLNGTAESGMNMLHDISGFTDISITNNVTFFEDMTVTGTDTVTVQQGGVLNLRLKKNQAARTEIATATHAFSDRDGKHEMIIKGSSLDETGTLNFITNGIGKEIKVDMENITLQNMEIKASSIIDTAKVYDDYIHLGAGSDLKDIVVNPTEVKRYNQLNKIYRSIYNSADIDTGKNLDALRDILNITYLGKDYDYNNRTKEEQLINLLGYLGSVYTESPYSYSSELSRRSVGMFRDIVTENQFRPNLNKWMIMGGLTHADGGAKDTYYGRNHHGFDTGTSETNVDMKLTGAYMLAKYGYSENTSLGLTLGGNKSEAEMSMSKVKGNSGYIGTFAENYRGNLTLKAGAGIQYSEYDADRRTIGGHSYDEKYSDMAYDIYLNGRYSHNIGDNLFLEPYATLSYTYIDQDNADEGSKVLAIETDSKSFDYTVGKMGLDFKKVIPHEKGKSTLSAGASYTKIFDGADEEFITGRFKGGTDFDILVAHKNEHSIGLNAKYTLELENGVLFDVKGTYSIERDSHNNSGKNKTKGEWIVGAGIGYKF